MKIAVSVGDPNGVGLEILLRSHKRISKICKPLYCVDEEMLIAATKKLSLSLPKHLKCVPLDVKIPQITPGTLQAECGAYSYASFLKALELTLKQETQAFVTLPVHKKAWQLAGIKYAGHTEALRDKLHCDSIMMLGSPKLYVALFSDHIRLRDVSGLIQAESLKQFLLDFSPHITKYPCGVLGLNPHAGDFGVLGDEEESIVRAIKEVNTLLGKEVFVGPLVPDTAFVGKHLRYYVAMYHDQGLIPLKTLYFKESINITLNLPVVRTSVDHGTAFDIAYQKKAKLKSYFNAVKEAILRVRMSQKESKLKIIKKRL